MRNILFRSFVVVLFLALVFSFASEDVKITVVGTGADKEAAVNNALRSALEQPYGPFVFTNTKTQ